MNQCTIVQIENIYKHTTNSKLWLVALGGSRQILAGSEPDGSCHYEVGQLGIFIPVGAIVPDKLAEEMWVKGRLAGKKKNRVKTVYRDGVLSDGLFYGSPSPKVVAPSWNPAWKLGDDVTAEIGVTFADTSGE